MRPGEVGVELRQRRARIAAVDQQPAERHRRQHGLGRCGELALQPAVEPGRPIALPALPRDGRLLEQRRRGGRLDAGRGAVPGGGTGARARARRRRRRRRRRDLARDGRGPRAARARAAVAARRSGRFDRSCGETTAAMGGRPSRARTPGAATTRRRRWRSRRRRRARRRRPPRAPAGDARRGRLAPAIAARPRTAPGSAPRRERRRRRPRRSLRAPRGSRGTRRTTRGGRRGRGDRRHRARPGARG